MSAFLSLGWQVGGNLPAVSMRPEPGHIHSAPWRITVGSVQAHKHVANDRDECEEQILLRQRTSDCGGVAGLGAGASRGGDAGFCVLSLASVPAVCCWLPASRSTLCRKLASAANVPLSCSTSCFSCAKSFLSCCSSGEAVACVAAVCAGAACRTDADSIANEISCGHIVPCGLPYHCQTKLAPTPIENAIRKRTRSRETLLPSDGGISPRSEPAIASSPGRATSGWCAASRKRRPTLPSSPSTSASVKCVGVTVEIMGTSPPLVSHHPVAGPRLKGAGRAAKHAPSHLW